MSERFRPELGAEFPAIESIQRYCKELLRQGRNVLAIALPIAGASPEALSATEGVALPSLHPHTMLHLDVNFVRPNGDLRSAQFTLQPENGAQYRFDVAQAPQSIPADASPVGIVSVENDGNEAAQHARGKATLDTIAQIAKEMKNARMTVKEGDVSVGWKFSADFGRNDVMHITPTLTFGSPESQAFPTSMESLAFRGAHVQVTVEPKNWKPPFAK